MKKGDKTKSVGVQDIAEKLNISPSTVSRALNNHPKISRATKERVLEAALKMGYNPTVPNLMAPEKNDVIALVVPDIERAFYRKIITGARNALKENDLDLIIFIAPESQKTAGKFQENCLKMNIRGIIHVARSRNNSLFSLEGFHKNNMPCVAVNYPQEGFPYSYVVPDIFQGAYDLTQHLIESGCHSFALFTEDPENFIDATITDGFYSALERHQIEAPKRNVFFISKGNRQAIIHQLKTMIKKGDLPEGLVATSPEIAFIILNFFSENGVKVPEDIFLAVIGTDQDTYFFTPPLSELVLPGNNLGQIAAGEIMKQLKDINYQPRTTILPVKFLIKNSTLKP